MCARYELNEPPANIAVRFGLAETPPLPNVPVVRPTDQALVVKMRGEARLCGWGLEVSWDTKPLINGRSETLADKPTFRPLLEKRCLVPATSYFEWRKDHGARFKNQIRPADLAIFAMAGLTDGDRFVILTCAPSPDIDHIHNRMPAILPRTREAAWLDPGLDFSAVARFLAPYSQASMIATEETPRTPEQRDLFH